MLNLFNFRPMKKTTHLYYFLSLGHGKYGSFLTGASTVKISKHFSSACQSQITTSSYHDVFSQHIFPRIFHRTSSCTQLLILRQKQTDSKSSQLEAIKCKKFEELYFSQNIRLFRMLGRLAGYSSLICIIGVPASFVGAILQFWSSIDALGFSKITIFYALLFSGQSWLFSSRVVMKIMLSSDNEYLKISHFSFFGNRKDLFIKASNVVPISDSNIFAKKFVIFRLSNFTKALIFLPQQGTKLTNYEALEMLLVGDKNKNDMTR